MSLIARSGGTNNVPAGEVAMMSKIEVTLASVLGYLILGEVPAATTIIGGGIVIAAVLWSQR
jgi:drug/metabolite transporter (DMT)-like permease